ncbi:Cadherin-like protein 28 [Pteropus alecto]|uniref:Cadherin-like protein 28 n=1 Tax=Pteropus alecto TaxID=9402 RepID=L5JQV6_PTEAL|nr:Cadherin-like protein 28 [Pteropus alecto]
MSFCIFLKSTGSEALHLIHLPATSNVTENALPETSVHKFSVKLSASLSPVISRFPLIINSNPLTEAFRVNRLSDTDFEVVTTGKEQLDFETGPKIFDLQIYIKDDVGATDLQVLTVQVTDVNEPPQFLGNLAKGQDLYIVEGANPGFIYQVEAFDPEDTSRNIPLSSPKNSKEKEEFYTGKQGILSWRVASWFSLRQLLSLLFLFKSVSFDGAASGALVTIKSQVKKPLSLSLGKDAPALPLPTRADVGTHRSWAAPVEENNVTGLTLEQATLLQTPPYRGENT